MERKEAKPYWRKGVFCIILQRDPSNSHRQPVAIGIDPGSKRTAFTVTTEKKVVLNMLFNTPHWVKKAVELRRLLRRGRRNRKTPYRKCRFNRKIGGIPPSTKSRWQAHIRVIKFLMSILPISDVVVEDVQAKTLKGKRKWNVNFSPLEVGKKFFDSEVGNLKVDLSKFKGFETSEWRKSQNYPKTSKKLEDSWKAHNVDSHCLCEMFFMTTLKPFKGLVRCDFLQFHRRQLHPANPAKGGKRKPYGTTVSLGVPRGMLLKHPTHGLCLLGGNSKGKVSLHTLKDYKRITKGGHLKVCRVLSKQPWTSFYLKEKH